MLTSPIETNNVVERLRDYIYDCTKDEFGNGWTLSAEQARHAITLASQSLSDRINVLEGALQLVRRIAKPLIEVDDVWEDSTHIVTAIDNALTQGGKTNG